jgi:capsular exopolysaccharide synthesis family protein
MQRPDPEPQLLDVREFLGVVRRRRISIVLVTVLVVGVALLLVYRRTPVYSSTARVEVRPLIAGGDLQGFYYDLLSNMDTEAQRVTSRDVATIAGQQLGVVPEDEQLTVNQIAELTADVSTSIPANTTYIDITCTTLEPTTSQACADAFAAAYVADRESLARRSADAARQGVEDEIAASQARIAELEKQLAAATDPGAQADITAQIDIEERAIDTARLQLLAVPTASPNPALLALPASLPTAPSNKDYVTTGVLATIVGLALGVGVAFVRERLDERVGRREGMESAIGAPVLAVVPRVPSWRSRNEARLVTIDAPDTVTAEAYRTARTTLLYLASREDIKVIVITGPGEGEGKTTTTANLATALAQAGKRVVVVSADLRKPRLRRFFGIDDHIGLTEVLQGTTTLRDAIASTAQANLKVLPSGAVPPNPAELLASSTMDETIATLRSVADFVLIDTPPSLVVADALELAPKTDGIIVVVDGSKTTRQAATHLRHQLERVGGLIVGGILNNLDPGQEAPYGRYYRSKDASYRKPTRKARKQRAKAEPAPQPPVPAWDPTAAPSWEPDAAASPSEPGRNGDKGSVGADLTEWR